MKLFGGKKGGAPNQNTENAVISEAELTEVLPVQENFVELTDLSESLEQLDGSLFEAQAEAPA